MSYMMTVGMVADQVSRWVEWGIKLSKELARAVEVYEKVRWAEVARPFSFDVADITPDNVDEKIAELADRIARETFVPGSLPPANQAKARLMDATARQVISLAAAEVDAAAEQLKPEFLKQAGVYVAAVRKLPEEITSESILEAGADVAAAYTEARAAAGHIERASQWVGSTGQLAGHGYNVPEEYRVLRPTVTQQGALHVADLKHRAGQCDSALAALNPIWVAAVRAGVEFELHTLKEASEIKSSISSPGTFSVEHR